MAADNGPIGHDSSDMKQSDDLVPRWYAEQPAHSCQDCGKESLFKCHVSGLYDGEKQRTRSLCSSCRAKRNERLEQKATSTTGGERSDE